MFNLLYLNSIGLQNLSELLELHFPVEVTIGLVQDLLQSRRYLSGCKDEPTSVSSAHAHPAAR